MLLKKTLYIFTKTAPTISARLALKYLFKPNGRRTYEFRTKIKPQSFTIPTQSGKVSLYKFSQNHKKSVFLSHGWADSSTRFTQVIDHLNESGFDVWTLDHIGHGRSEKSTANIFTFIDGVESSLDFIKEHSNEPNALLGHSMGSLAVLNLPEEVLKNKKIILISAPTKFFENIFKRVDALGIPKILLLKSFNFLSKKYKKKWEELSPDQQVDKLNKNFLFIHDEDDITCSYKNIKGLVKGHPHEFMSTQGLGHLKILKDPAVLENIVHFINP